MEHCFTARMTFPSNRVSEREIARSKVTSVETNTVSPDECHQLRNLCGSRRVAIGQQVASLE